MIKAGIVAVGRAGGRIAPFVSATLAVGLFALPPAQAGSCLEQVNSAAEAHHLSVEPPDARPAGPGVTSGDLSKSGGVIEPPKVGDPAVVEPPGGVRYGMPTVPDVTSDAPRARMNGTSDTLSAQDVAILESILVAARADAQRGDEAGCFKKMRKAQDFLESRT